MSSLLIITAAGLCVCGFCASILGSVKIPLARQLAIDEARIGGLVSTFSITFLPVVIATGWLVDSVGPHIVLAVAMIGMAVGLGLLARASSYPTALVAVVVFGVHWSALINVVHVLIPIAFPGPIAVGTNLADVCFSIGAMTTPLLAVAFLRRDRFRGLFVRAAVVSIAVSLPCFVMVAGLGMPIDAVTATDAKAVTGGGLLAHPLIWLCGLCLCCFGPIEIVFATWTSSYLVERGYDATFGTRMISAFWAASLLGRLLVALFLPVGHEATVVLALAVLGTFVVLGVVLTKRKSLAPLLVIGGGLASGPVFPTVLAVLFDGFNSSEHGRAVGVTLAISNLGYTSAPILVGMLAKRTSVQRSFIIPLVSGIAFVGCSALLVVWR